MVDRQLTMEGQHTMGPGRDTPTADAEPVSDVSAHTSTTSAPALEITNLQKRFRRPDGTVVEAVKDVSLRVEPGEFVVLLGPSGCGKTTLLRSVAGLEEPDSGRISIGGQDVFDPDGGLNLGPEHRRFSMVFQTYALWPHPKVFANV